MIAHPQTLDFALEIGEAVGGRYPVAVLDSPAGECRQTMLFPDDGPTLQDRLAELTAAFTDTALDGHQTAPTSASTARGFGTALFDAVFSGQVGRLFDVSRARAHRQGAALRVQLRCRTPELAAMPWEFLYDSAGQEYLCLSRQTPLVRYLEVAGVAKAARVELPLRVLGVVVGPHGPTDLGEARERQRVEEALAPLVASGMVVVSWLAEATSRGLQQALDRESWHVVHFVGGGTADPLGADQVGALLGAHPTLRLAILDGCAGTRSDSREVSSNTAAELVRRGAPAALAMQYPITDRADREFARSFYDALAAGLPVDTALAEARKALCVGVSGTLEWGAPILFVRAAEAVHLEEAPSGRRTTAAPVPASAEAA